MSNCARSSPLRLHVLLLSNSQAILRRTPQRSASCKCLLPLNNNDNSLRSIASLSTISITPSSMSFRVGRDKAMGNIIKRGVSGASGTDTPQTENAQTQFENREVLVQHILVPEDKAELLAEIQSRVIKEGADLSDLAREYSICPSKEEGGMLGWVEKGQMVPEFEEAAFNSPLNKLVRCKTSFGWHLLQVLSEREGGTLQNIESHEFHARVLADCLVDEVQLLDVREPEELELASMPAFVNYPLRQFGKWAPNIITDLDPSKDTYVMCHHGMRSLQVAKWLKTQGFKRVYNISGGIHQYSVQVDSTIPTY